MTIRKIIIKVEEEQISKIHDVEISTENLMRAIKDAKSTEYLWLYIDGWIKGEKTLEKE